MKIKLLIDGGDMKPGPAIAQQLGPMGINMGKVISEINAATKEFKGMKVPVELDVNQKTKAFTIHTSSPPTAELIKKELGLEKGSNNHKEMKVGNASIEDVIKIAKIKSPNMLEKNLKNAVKSILGTCASIGIFVEDKEPNELIQEVEAGKFDKEINEERTVTSTEKRKDLNEYFKSVKSAQEAKIEAAKKAAEEAEAKKEEETKEAAKPEAGKAAGKPVAAEAKKEAGKAPAKKAEGKKPEGKK